MFKPIPLSKFVHTSTYALYEYLKLLYEAWEKKPLKIIEEEICWVQREIQERGHKC